MESLIFASATTLAERIRTGEVTALAVVEAHLARITQVNPQLNAIEELSQKQLLLATPR